MTIVLLPRGVDPSGIAGISPQFATGLLSAGLGSVPADQTYLDIGQGNRLFDSLYPDPAPPLYVLGSHVPRGQWERALERAAGAPAEIVPGLLGDELAAAGVPVTAGSKTGEPALLGVDSEGRVARDPGCDDGSCPGLTILDAEPEEVPGLIAAQDPGDILIALERPPPVGRLLSIGIAGDGFEGILTSPATRLDGYVLSTDLAPTILDRYEIEVPEEMSGRLIGSKPEGEAAAVADLDDRLEDVTPRRHPVLGVNVMIWVALTALAALLFGGRGARIALPAIASTVAWVPALLLVGALLTPSVLAERLIVGAGGPALALLSLWGFGRVLDRARAMYAAFALAAAASVLLTAIDILAGSPLTALSLIGPNPGLGVRFFGIGNELEATIGVLLALGSGAAVTAIRPADPLRSVTIATAVAALAAVLVFAPGRFGADVGAAITFPAAAAGVALAAYGLGRKRLALFIAAPILALAALIAVDLAIGGDAHLSRSVLDAGGLDQLGDVLERRVRLSASSFSRFFDSLFFSIALGIMIVGVICRKWILAWLEPFPAARAGFIGAVVASVIGALANDSGSLLLMIGTAYLAAFAGMAFSAQYFTSDSKSR